MNNYAHVYNIVHIDDFYSAIDNGKLLNRLVSEEHQDLRKIGLKATWFSPSIFGQQGSFYGNIAFCIDFINYFWNESNFRFYFYQETKYNSETKVFRYLISRNDYSQHTFLHEIQKVDIKKGNCKWWIGNDNNVVIENSQYPNKNIIEFIVDEEIKVTKCDGILFLTHGEKCVKELSSGQKCKEKGKTFQEAQKQVVYELIIKNIALKNLKLLRLNISTDETQNIIRDEVFNHPFRYSKEFNQDNYHNNQEKQLMKDLLKSELEKDKINTMNILKQFKSLDEFEKNFTKVFEEFYNVKIEK
jgi:hypothetical protein